MPVRAFLESDLAQVVDLYWNYMRRREGSAPQGLRSSFQRLYFANPWTATEKHSIVYEGANGKIVGFLGIICRQMCACGEPVRVAFGGNFVVHPVGRSQLAGPRLLGTYLALKFDLWQTDSANDTSRQLLEGLGFRTIPALSIHWARPLRPSRYAVRTLSRSMSPMASASLRTLASPFCSVADYVASKLPANPFGQKKSHLLGAEADAETLLQCFAEFRKGYSMWPEYDPESLQWLLGFMDRNSARGTLRKVVLRDQTHKIVGWYIYYVKPGAVGEVAQVGGKKKSIKAILDHLFYDAWEHGLIALHGVVPNRMMADFSDKGCFFSCRGGWTVAKARKPELMDLLERGDVCFSRLDGEWCLNPAD